jgi:hypothetical protein
VRIEREKFAEGGKSMEKREGDFVIFGIGGWERK